MTDEQTPDSSTQTPTIQAQKSTLGDADLAKLMELRDRAAREKKVAPSELIAPAVSEAVTQAKKASAKRLPMPGEDVPPLAKAMREAARSKPLTESFGSAADKCVKNLAAQLGELYSPTRAGLDAFRVYDPSGEQGAVVKRVREFIDDIEAVLSEARGLVLFGSVGTGKDHLLAAALYRVAGAAIPTAWLSGQAIFQRMRDSMDSGEREKKIMDAWLAPTVLGLSDPVPVRGELSDWNTSVLARLLDARYRAMRPTWITMNAANEADACAKLSSLVWDRLRDNAEILPCFWQSFRALRRQMPAGPIAGKIAAAS